MGIASTDLTGDGYPEVYLTSQGDNKLQTLADGPAQPTYEDIALDRGATAHRPYTGGTRLPSTAWHAEFADVNNDGLLDLFVAKGNVDAQEGYAMRGPQQPVDRSGRRHVRRRRRGGGDRQLRPGPGAALVDLNLDGLLDLVVANRVEPATVWRNVGSGDADAPAAMGNWLADPATATGAERRRHRRLGRGQHRRAHARPRAHRRRRPRRRAARLAAPRARRRRPRRAARALARWRGQPWMESEAGGFAIIERGAAAVTPGRRK